MKSLRFKKILWLLIYISSPLIPLCLYFADSWYAFFDNWSIAITLGIFSYIYFLNQVIIGSRPKYWEKIYGLNKLLSFHKIMAIISIMLIFIHLLLKLSYSISISLQIYLGIASISIIILISIISILFMMNNKRPPAPLNLQYQHFRTIHNIICIALTIIVIHVLLASSTRETLSRSIVMIIWYIITISFYLYNKLIKPYFLNKKLFIVIDKKQETRNIIKITLKKPESSNFNFSPGQFIFIKFINGFPGKEEHPFTISSILKDNCFSITVKNLGDWTNKLMQINIGDKASVDGPYGVFSYTRIQKEYPLCFIAGGIGITPFLSMLNYIYDNNIKRKISLIWQARKKEDLFALKIIKEIKKRIPNFTFISILSREKDWEGNNGRMDYEFINNLDFIKNRIQADYFICGPNDMLRDVIKHLKRSAVKKRHIHYEKFSM